MLKGAVVGFGRMGMIHFSTLNTHPDVQFVAVCDSSKMILKNLARYTGMRGFTDFREMLAEVELDFAIVATPTSSHTDIASAAAERGVHVFLEKPYALDEGVGRELAESMLARSLVGQVGYFLRFSPIYNLVARLLEEKKIGDVVHYKNEMHGRTVLKRSKSSWRAKPRMGGGCMMDFGSHCLDLADYLFGPVDSVGGSVLKSIHSAEVEDSVFSTLVHDSGATGHLMVNWSDESYRRPFNRIEITGVKGRIVADRQECRVFLREADEGGEWKKGWNARYLPQLERGVRFTVRGAEFAEQLDKFIEGIQRGSVHPGSGFTDALRTDRVINLIVDDSEKTRGQRAWIG